ncbi:putative glucokinase [Diaporthe ampelina]|uniref:Putative glucokinase n=1 Tax=Diaporthe ampelina TaxID=1214573 RepID=A0A0G2I9T7_9PEZI|nr:putative glucokinase [Diaporthe ampelina]
MFMSIECGSFNRKLSVLPATPYDTELDRDGVNPGNQMFEKRTSATFLRELLHESIEDLEVSADAGCRFCKLLLACLNGYLDNGNWIAGDWKGEENLIMQ